MLLSLSHKPLPPSAVRSLLCGEHNPADGASRIFHIFHRRDQYTTTSSKATGIGEAVRWTGQSKHPEKYLAAFDKFLFLAISHGYITPLTMASVQQLFGASNF